MASASRIEASIRVLAAMAGILACGGCATLAHGDRQSIPVTSNPPGLAIYVNGAPAGQTPTVVTVPRGARHLVEIGSDSAKYGVVLERRLSAWVFGNILVYTAPLFVDIARGGSHNLHPAVVHAVLPGRGAALLGRDTLWGLVPGDEALVTWRGGSWTGGVDGRAATGAMLRLVGFSDAHPEAEVADARVYLRQPPDRGTAGALGMRTTLRVALLVPALLFGPAVGGLAYVYAAPFSFPLGYAGGAALAQPRWVPLEARRAGLPLARGDRLRLRLADSTHRRLSARLLYLDEEVLVVRAGPDTLPLPRHSVTSLERATGAEIGRGVRMAFAAAALVGIGMCVREAGCRPLDVAAWAPVIVLGGLLVGPAIAPRRWESLDIRTR